MLRIQPDPEQLPYTFVHLCFITQWMRFSLVVRASNCRSRNSPGFDPSILRHSGIWGAADEAVLNTLHRKNIKNPLVFLFHHFIKVYRHGFSFSLVTFPTYPVAFRWPVIDFIFVLEEQTRVRGQRGIHQGAGQPGHGSQGSAAHTGEVGQLATHQCYEAESRGAEIKLPPGSGAEITNCGSGSSSCSFL